MIYEWQLTSPTRVTDPCFLPALHLPQAEFCECSFYSQNNKKKIPVGTEYKMHKLYSATALGNS